jgi:RHS repeat-associated protein
LGKTGPYFIPEDFTDILSDVRSDVAEYHKLDKPLTAGMAQRRLIEQLRTTFYRNDLTGSLPLHQLESLALPFESYQLAYTPELVADVFGARVNVALLDEARFVHSEGDDYWWVRSGSAHFIQGTEDEADARSRFFVPMSYTDPFGAVTKLRYYGSYFLSVEETENDLGNRSGVHVFNFRTLSPEQMRDVNGNLSAAISDELGLVKALAIMGKGSEADELTGLSEITDAGETLDVQDFFNSPDSVRLTAAGIALLGRATTRYLYDLEAFIKTGKPVAVASVSREQHFQQNNDSPVQIAFEYTNGLGETVMKKVQAEPGLALQVIVNDDLTITVNKTDTSASNPKQLRWIGNGRTVKNNKGNLVKQYEPYFSVTHQYEDFKELVETGVTPVIYYDAPGRAVKTEMPDGTFSKTELGPWKQSVYDANDTILKSDWYTNRTNRLIDAELIADGKHPLREKQAADQATRHANTPQVMHLDTQGRTVLSIEHNKNILTDADEFYNTVLLVDTEGNLRSVTDARGNVVMQYKYDILGNKVYQNSPDSGQRWQFLNVVDNPARNWDERGHEFRFFYDHLQRPTQSRVLGGDGPVPLDHIFGRVIYGESLLLPDRSNEVLIQADNVLGQPIQLFDTAGVINTPDYDFKEQPVSITRRLFRKYNETANWTDANLAADLENETFTFITETDAIGRITSQVAPDGSIITPSYNEAGLLNGETVLHPGAAAPVFYIRDIDYNEKGQREKVVYGNRVTTRFYYDKETFRMKRLESRRQNNDPLQDWNYTFDPSGNITHIEDRNIPVVFFNNQKITGVAEYNYDALYRLTEAKGRENDAALAFGGGDNWDDTSFMHQLNPGDPMSVRQYTQHYQYDEVGNMLQMRHIAAGNNWTRDYTYAAISNRVISSQVGGNVYNYPHHAQHGFITEMPHLQEMGWNFKEELAKTARQRRTDGGTAETTYYQYDGSGQRIRKITENQAAPGVVPTKKEERIYVSGYELYKKHSGSDAGLERVSLSLIDEGHRFVIAETRNDFDNGTEKHLVRYQLHNHIGSAALELDGTDDANVISYEEYHPFGTTAYQAKNNAIRSAAKRYRFTGMERDEETGLEYHSARYYLPWLGRWLSADPIGIGDGVNVYVYAKNNSIQLVDEQGTQCNPAMHCCTDSGSEYESADVIFNPNDVVYQIASIQAPGTVADWWANGPRSNREEWAHPLSEMEQGYIDAMRDSSVPAALRMRAPVNPGRMTSEETEAADRLFGSSSADHTRYANYENRRRIIAHYVLTHPATIRLQLGIYRLFRDANPLHFALERGWQMGGGREMFTEEPVSRLGAAVEFFAALAISYGISRGLRALRFNPATGARPSIGSIGDDANFAQKTYRNAFTTEPGAGFRGMTVDQVAEALRSGAMHPRMVPVDYIVREGNTLILNTRSAQALTEAGIPRSQWAGVNRTGNPAFEARLTGQLTRNRLTTAGTPTVTRTRR